MKIGIFVDNMAVARWQADAIRELRGVEGFILYNCLNSRPAPRRLKHIFYYALNLFTVRNALSRLQPVPVELGISDIVDFETESDGAWQRLPEALLDRIAGDGPALILKFGMGLLRIPDVDRLPVPILSYHHGDPRHFRGRPAGFYEIMEGRPVIGQVVQILSNALDAGTLVAYGETKAYPHSYKTSLKDAYRHSKMLLNQAVDNLLAGVTVPKSGNGRNYRLPSNLTIIRFCLKMGWEKLKRLFYGAFVEKGWQVAEAAAEPHLLLEARIALPAETTWRHAPIPNGFRFLADPFFHPDGDGLLAEGLSRSTGRGQLLHLGRQRITPLSDPALHHSYPAGMTVEGIRYLIPEVASWSAPKIFRLHDDRLEEVGMLELQQPARLLDPTLYASGDTLFLFANVKTDGSSVLRLWHSDSLFAPFVEHPRSPIRVSPAGSRMGGAIVEAGSSRIRIGQDFRGQYGDGLIFFRIDSLTREDYGETQLAEFKLEGRSGPHTLNFRDGRVTFDWYRSRLSPLAGLRRLNLLRS